MTIIIIIVTLHVAFSLILEKSASSLPACLSASLPDYLFVFCDPYLCMSYNGLNGLFGELPYMNNNNNNTEKRAILPIMQIPALQQPTTTTSASTTAVSATASTPPTTSPSSASSTTTKPLSGVSHAPHPSNNQKQQHSHGSVQFPQQPGAAGDGFPSASSTASANNRAVAQSMANSYIKPNQSSTGKQDRSV